MIHEQEAGTTPKRTIGWVGATALAMGGSNQSLFLLGALLLAQGTAAIPLLMIGLLLSLAAAPGWTELVLMWPNRIGGIAATCAEAFRPYSPVLANLTGVGYWWGWVPACGLSALLSATAISQWYLPQVPVPVIAVTLVLVLLAINLCGIRWVARMAIPSAIVSFILALLSGLIPVLTGHVDWHQATTFHLVLPFPGLFGGVTNAMAGLFLIVFAAPAFEAAVCHVGEMVHPTRTAPRAMLASALIAVLYFAILPMVWLGLLGAAPLTGDLSRTLGPAFAPWFGLLGRPLAVGFIILNMFHGTLQPLAGTSRTLAQLADDGLLPRIFSLRSRTDTPWVASVVTAGVAIMIMLLGAPTWILAAAGFTYLISISLPSVAVWLLRKDAPQMVRPYRAPRGMVLLGLLAALGWGITAVLGFQQFGLPTVLAGLGLAYSGSLLYAVRTWRDHRGQGTAHMWHSLHVKLTGAMLLVLVLDSGGYLLALRSVSAENLALISGLEDIFVVVALLTITVGLILPGMIAQTASDVAHAADTLAVGTLTDLAQAMQALEAGNLEAASARVDICPIVVHSHDEIGQMATSFNTMQERVAQTAVALGGAREGLRQAREDLTTSNRELARWGTELEQRVEVRTEELQQTNVSLRSTHEELQQAHDELAALATTDPLTGLPNHRSLMASLDKELERGRRYRHCFATLFLDLDHFKALNDSCGHEAGDTALKELGTIARASLRGSDTMGRWGGEEFLALLPETTQETALLIAERMRAAISAYSFNIGGGLHMTASLGIAMYPQDAMTRSALVEAADRAMYTAKKLGRNQLRTASDPATLALKNEAQEQGSREEALLVGTVEALASLVQVRDQYTEEQSHRLSALTMRMALALGLSTAEARMISLAARLYDVGKIAIPEAILQKHGPLTEEEWTLIRKHPAIGAEVVGHVPTLGALVPGIHWHHERWDGTGYPDGLAGNLIPLGARILGVVDAYGAMTADRPYRKASDATWARDELRRCAGTQFDPAVVDALDGLLTTDMLLEETAGVA